MNFFQFIFQDWKANTTKGRIIMLLFRIANFCSTKKIFFYLGIPYLFFYKFLVEWIFCIEIPYNIKAGKNLVIYHGQCLVIGGGVIIGENCVLRHCTTIGNKQTKEGKFSSPPVLGNNVDVGSNVCIIGNIKIMDNVKIGSGSVVIKNVSGNCIVVGNPGIEKRTEFFTFN